MNCLDCQELLHRRLDGEVLAGSSELERHLAECPACREQHQAATRFLDALRARALAELPTALSSRLVAAVLYDRRRRRRQRWWTGLAVAASLMLMVLAGYLWWSSDDSPPNGGPIVQGKDEVKPAVPLEPPLAQSFDEARDAVGSLTNRLAETTREQAKLLLAAHPLDLTLPDLEPAVAPLRQTGQGVSEGVQTVTRSAQRAVSYFVREITQLDAGVRN